MWWPDRTSRNILPGRALRRGASFTGWCGDPRSLGQRIAEVVEAVVPVSIAGPARDRLVERGEGLGAVNVADGAR